MTDHKLDSFLDAIDDDPDWSSDEEDDRIQRRINQEEKCSSASKSSHQVKETGGLSFEDVFGSPIKKKQATTPSTSASTSNNFDGVFFETLRKQETQENFAKKTQVGRFLNTGPMPSGPSQATCIASSSQSLPQTSAATKPNSSSSENVIDPYSRISLFKSSINLYCDESMTVEAVLKDRNLGIPYIHLLGFDAWYRNNKDGKKFWTTGVLCRKLGLKTSSNGNEYTIWEVNDLKDLEKSWSLFLFSTAATATSVSSIPVGSVIDIVTPSVMAQNVGPVKLSVNTVNQIRHIATARYFGHCSGKRKDGTPCSAVVNTIECPVCIHHASKELRKMNAKGKPVNGTKNAKAMVGSGPKKSSDDSGSQPGVKTVNFGSLPAAKVKPRMELQGGMVKMDRNSLRLGNPSSVSFDQPKNKNMPKVERKAKPELKLDPAKTKHLTEKDRMILESMGAKQTQSDLPEMLATMPNAGARNFLRFLAEQQYKTEKAQQDKTNEDQITGFGKPVEMNRSVLDRMKKALNYVRANGPIKKADPNKVGVSPADRKRKLQEDSTAGSGASGNLGNSPTNFAETKRRKSMPNIEVEFDFEAEEVKKIMNAKSKHEKVLEEKQQDEYFEKLEKKEAIENKLLNTFSIDTTAVMCKQCKYIALSKSDLCKELNHTVKIVKAVKRFFKCKDCGNRTMSLDRLPNKPCSNCKSSSWLAAPVGKERKGPTLDSETLCIRGDEEKFLGSSSAKLCLSNVSAD